MIGDICVILESIVMRFLLTCSIVSLPICQHWQLTSFLHVMLILTSLLQSKGILWTWDCCKSPPMNPRSPLSSTNLKTLLLVLHLTKKVLFAPIERERMGTSLTCGRANNDSLSACQSTFSAPFSYMFMLHESKPMCLHCATANTCA